jgi:hypothetical protein
LSHTCSLFFSGYFGDGGLTNYLPRLSSNCDPPDLSFSSSQDYRIIVPGQVCNILLLTMS